MGSKTGIMVSSLFFLVFYMMILFIGLVSCLCLISDAAAAETTCKNGTIGECSEEEEMVMMESEISKRLMMEQKKFISTGALRRDKPVCNGGGSGEAYSKSGGCLPPPSNPHTRGCSKYYRCRSDS